MCSDWVHGECEEHWRQKNIYDMGETRLKTVIDEKDLSSISRAIFLSLNILLLKSKRLSPWPAWFGDRSPVSIKTVSNFIHHCSTTSRVWSSNLESALKKTHRLDWKYTAESIQNDPWLIAPYLPTKNGSSALTNSPISQVLIEATW